MFYTLKRITSGALIASMMFSMMGGLSVAHAAAPLNYFSVSLTPTSATTKQVQSYSATVTNLDNNNDIKSVTFEIPSGFSVTELSSITGWLVSTSTNPGFIAVRSTSNTYKLAENESFVVTFTAKAPNTASVYTLTTAAYTSENPGSGVVFDLSGSQPTITVTPGTNNAPVATAQSVSTNEDTSVGVTLAGTDADLDTLSYTVATNPTNGVLTGTVPNLTYTPNLNYNGSDSFTFTVNDGTDTSAPATVTISVASINDAPVLGALSDVTVNELSVVNFTASANDVDGDSITYSLSGAPAGATINPTTGEFSWTPSEAQGTGASYTFDVVANDGKGGTDTKTVTLTVNEVNSAPTASAVSVTTQLNTAKTITLVGLDSDIPAQTLVYAISTNPTNGVLGSVSGNQVTYTPNGSFTGTDTFTYEVFDGVATSSTATVTVTVGNDAPSINSIANQTGDEGSPITFTATGNDPNSDPLSYSLSGDVPSGATINPTTGEFSWTPSETQGPGTYTFSVVVSDGVASDSTTVTITVNESNSTPKADNLEGEGAVYTQEDTAKSGTLTGSDTDIPAQVLSFATTSNPTNGTLTSFDSSNGNFTYLPNLNYNGSDSFTFTVSDGVSTSEVATATITVTPVNDLPIITLLGSTSTTVIVGTATSSVELGATASDVEDGDITESIVRTGSFDLNTIGTYTLTYSVTDSNEGTAEVTRTITVVAQPVTPPTGSGGGAGGTNGVPGCRDPKALNYDATAVYDGTCVYPQVLGASTSTVSIAETPKGEVLGASTTTAPVCVSPFVNVKKAIRPYRAHDTTLITALQNFLNGQLGLNVPTTGYFGTETANALKKYQTLYKDEVLTPWGLSTPTGIMYVTTTVHINNKICPELNMKYKQSDLVPARD
jgi:hypothetical protein